MIQKYVCFLMIIIVPEDWHASIMTDRRRTVTVLMKLFGRRHAVYVNMLNEIIAEDLDLILFKSILRETASWTKKN